MFSFIVKFIVVVTVWNIASAKLIGDAVREETETERIVGGKTASPGKYPWAAALYYDDQFICTSSIISPTTVLTAAHCVQFNGVTQPAEIFYAIANVSRSALNVRINFTSVTPHPDFYEDDEQIENDVALFKTTKPIPFSKEVQSVCIARPNTPMKEYKDAIAMGWGDTAPSWLKKYLYLKYKAVVEMPDKLQYAKLFVKFCPYVSGIVNDDKICATRLAKGICNGDSGGPLVHISKGKPPVEIGIASYLNDGTDCGKPFSGVWTRVSSHYDFIMETANDTSICTV